jgi:hypothetical protein
MTKYNPTLRDLEQPGGIEKLERDGFSNEQIHKEMYRQTEGASQQYRTRLMEQLYIREKSK